MPSDRVDLSPAVTISTGPDACPDALSRAK
jgi:hypothetical protein